MIDLERNIGTKIRSEWFHGLGSISMALADRLYNIKVSSETLDNLANLEGHLKQGSVLAYINHVCLEDGPLAMAFLMQRLGRSIRSIGAPASKKHLDGRDGLRDALVMRFADFVGVNIVPIVQHYDTAEYDLETIEKSRMDFARTAKKVLSQPGGLFLLAPEGTRSYTKGLQEGQKGIGFLATLLRRNPVPVLLAPLGIIPQGQYERGEINWKLRQDGSGDFAIRVGQPFGLDEFAGIRDRGAITDIIMIKLADILPEDMRGFYSFKSF